MEIMRRLKMSQKLLKAPLRPWHITVTHWQGLCRDLWLMYQLKIFLLHCAAMKSLRLFCALVLLAVCVPDGICGPTSSNSRRKVSKSLESLDTKNLTGTGILLYTENEVHTERNDNLVTPAFSSESVWKIISQLVTASSAVEHLEKMKNKLLSQFEKKSSDFATARGGYGGYGAYGFPSLEGALLSIAFLTFAVFLIDLIQQLLSRFRTGTAGVVPLVGRRKRSIFLEDDDDHLSSLTSSVLHSLENNSFTM